MVEGDLVDLSIPTLLQALAKESSTGILRLQRGTSQGALYFCEGSLVHAASGDMVGDDAVLDLLSWSDGRFRIVRDVDKQPRTVTRQVVEFLASHDSGPSSSYASGNGNGAIVDPDEELLTACMALLSRLEQDRVRLEEKEIEKGPVPALLVIVTIVNSLVAFVTSRCTDPNLLPSRMLPKLADDNPYTQLLGEDNERISIATAAGVLKAWKTSPEDRRQLFQDLCRALLDMLAIYCNTVNSFFHSSREREEWRTTFDVFVDGLWTAVRQMEA